MEIFLFLAPVAAFPLAFLVGRIPSRTGRVAGLLVTLLLPIMILTIAFPPTGSAAGGLAPELGMALAMLGMPIALWCFAAIGGFFVGLSSRQPPA